MSTRNPQNERYTVERKERSQGSSKPRAASAKPASRPGASVRTEKKVKPKGTRQKAMAEMNMSKEEKKKRRAEERAQENIIYSAITTLTNRDAKYKKYRRWWWMLLIVAVIFTILAWVTLTADVPSWLSIAILVMAYGSIIAALVLDFTLIRKRRNAQRDIVAAMTQKQRERILAESYGERMAKEAAKKAAKEAKKAGKTKDEIKQAKKDAANAALGRNQQAIEDADKAGVFGEPDAGAEHVPTAEEERLAAAQKVARDFAASRR